MSRLIITSHAIDSYRDRVNPTWSRELCEEHLRRDVPHAIKLPEKTRTGEERWEIGDAILVVAIGPDRRGRRSRVIRTVLTKLAGTTPLPDWLQAEVDAAIAAGGDK